MSCAPERHQAETQLGLGLDRLDRLVTQMLALSRVEAGRTLARTRVRWHGVVEQAVNDCLMLAERRRIELCSEWPALPAGTPPGVAAQHARPLRGDEHLLTVMLRKLLDNAVRYAPTGTAVTLRIGTDRLSVENDEPPWVPNSWRAWENASSGPTARRKAAVAWACPSCNALQPCMAWRCASAPGRASRACGGGAA